MNFSEIRAYYERPDITDALLSFAKDREVVGVFRNGEFSKRPNTLVYPKDITAMVKQGVVEFHCSIEHWTNPMALKQSNYRQLRKGWDLILDLDCSDFEYTKIAAKVLMDELREHEINSHSIKFTGGKGFHIGVPWEAIPKEIMLEPTTDLYPELARTIGEYLKWKTQKKFRDELLRHWDNETIAERVGQSVEAIKTDGETDPWKVVELDPVLISTRHLFRMPYSLNRKSFLVSVPVAPAELDGFRKEMAAPGRIKADRGFIRECQPGEAEVLLIKASEWHSKRVRQERKSPAKRFTIRKTVPEKHFPPCIKSVLSGLSDGKKRSVFVLINFMRKMNWSWENIENGLLEWNKKNQNPLPDSYVISQLRYAKNRGTTPLPPNCNNIAYYKSLGICNPDRFCSNIKNPVTYPLKAFRTEHSYKRGRFKTRKQK